MFYLRYLKQLIGIINYWQNGQAFCKCYINLNLDKANFYCTRKCCVSRSCSGSWYTFCCQSGSVFDTCFGVYLITEQSLCEPAPRNQFSPIPNYSGFSRSQVSKGSAIYILAPFCLNLTLCCIKSVSIYSVLFNWRTGAAIFLGEKIRGLRPYLKGVRLTKIQWWYDFWKSDFFSFSKQILTFSQGSLPFILNKIFKCFFEFWVLLPFGLKQGDLSTSLR